MAGKRMAKEDRKPIVLQERDTLIMAFVAEFRLLTRPQLQGLLDFPCTTRINIRLKKLYDHGYLSRRFMPTIMGKPQTLYFLGPKGVMNVVENTGLDGLGLEKDRRHIQDHKDLFLNHQLFLNETRIAFTLAITVHPQISLERWIKERDCLIEFTTPQGMLTVLRPDGCL
ncbi:MAG TPA: replication-relaxation family protein, partial [Smithella sp.]|nr:replication-relaxation family protein [Smithella sp.]